MIKKFKIIFWFGFCVFLFFVTPKEVDAASLSLSPATKDIEVGESFTASVILDTQTETTDGADVIILYDAAKLSVASASLGDLYTNKLIEDTTTAGKVTFRATSSATDAFTGSGIFATIDFEAIADGDANVSFEFEAGSDTDSNVAYQGEDLLMTVSWGTYTVGVAAVGGATESAITVPVAGIVNPTILLAGIGFLLLLLPLFI